MGNLCAPWVIEKFMFLNVLFLQILKLEID